MTDLDVDYIEKCQDNLISFARACYHNFQAPWHIKELAKILERVERGELDRVMIQFPPRHGKSVLTSQIFPAWFAGRNPDRKIMLGSATQELATEFGYFCRQVFTHENYQLIFPTANIRSDSKAKRNFHYGKRGSAFFAGRKTQITGRGGHVLIVDDLIGSAKEADSTAYIKEARDWYKQNAYNRLEKDGAIIVIGTRWRENDIQGWLLDPEEQERIDNWHIFKFPAIAEEDELFRKMGEPLWPEKFDLAALERIQAEDGRVFNQAYQQRPSAVAGNIIQREWLPVEKLDEEGLQAPRVMFVDTAFKEGAENDYSAAVIGQRYKASLVAVLYAEQRKLNFPDLIDWIKKFAITYRLQAILVEDKASGPSVIQTLQKCINDPKDPFKVPVIAIPVKRGEDKISRVNAITPFLESRRVILHKWSPKSTQEDLINNLLGFPYAAHDDLTDSFTGLVTYLLRNSNSMRRLIGGRTIKPPMIYQR